MKKYFFWLFITIFFLFSSISYATDGQGTIQEIMECQDTGGWKKLLFKLTDGQWFGIAANFTGSSSTDFDQNLTSSLVKMAFISQLQLEVRISYDENKVSCGITHAYQWDTLGDYIKIKQ